MPFRNQISCLFFILIIMGSSCGQSGVVIDKKSSTYFETQLTAVITGYIRIKNTLVNNNPELAAQEARELRAYMEAIKMDKLDARAEKYWIDHEKAIRTFLAEIGTTEFLEKQEFMFYKLSSAIIEMVEEFGTVGLSLYKQYCPKALEGEGASWINEVKEIQNPYGGGLRCGVVKKKL